MLTLRQNGENYQFVANQMAENASGSVENPEGFWTVAVALPEAVVTAAEDYVQQDYAYWCGSSGVYATEDEMIGEPATYDNWRIEGMEQVYQYTDVAGYALDVYRLDYRIHTTTPDQVVLAGGMELDKEGWLLPTYPHSTYLFFSLRYTETGTPEPVYLFAMMENDCAPGDELFTSDLENRLRDKGYAGLRTADADAPALYAAFTALAAYADPATAPGDIRQAFFNKLPQADWAALWALGADAQSPAMEIVDWLYTTKDYSDSELTAILQAAATNLDGAASESYGAILAEQFLANPSRFLNLTLPLDSYTQGRVVDHTAYGLSYFPDQLAAVQQSTFTGEQAALLQKITDKIAAMNL